MSTCDLINYAERGVTIQAAMVDHATRCPNKKTRAPYILWGERHVQTSDVLIVPSRGIVEAELITATTEIRQGFDMKLNGWIQLTSNEKVSLLRTWKEDRFEEQVEYPFYSQDGRMLVWNVYEMIYPSGERVVEKWTENAGFWVEVRSQSERIYHCSHGMADPPNFDSLVFKISIKSI